MDTLFFIASKILWMLFSPASLLVLWLLVATGLLWFNRIVAAKRCLLALSLVVCLITVVPVGLWLLEPLERRFPTNPELPADIDGIVVLSGGEIGTLTERWQQVQLNEAAERNMALVALAKRFPQAKLVHTGGSSRIIKRGLQEADVAKQLFESLGVDMSRMQFERNARNTAENAKLTHQLVQPKVGEKWLLVTTAWHMPRSVGLFCQVGWPTIPYPVDHRTFAGEPSSLAFAQWQWRFDRHLLDFNIAIKEWLGLLVYYLGGKTPSLFPKSC